MTPPPSPTPARPRPVQDWRVLVAVFFVTSMVEGAGVSQIFALVPSYLRSMGVSEADRLAFVGLFSSLIFVVGMPLVPLWGVWADKYSRKAVIVRSALVEAAVFAGVALSREPWQLALSMLLIGFQLGNTGVMLAGIRDVTPTRRLGTTIAIFGASGPIGFALGPALAGVLIDGYGWSLPAVFWLSAALSVGTALLVAFGSREVRPEIVPTGRTIDLAFGAVRAVLADPIVRRIFLIFGVSFLATQMTRPYIPVLVEGLAGTGPGLGFGDRARDGHGGPRGRRHLAARWRARRSDRVPPRARRRPDRRRRRAARDAVRPERPRAGRSCGRLGRGDRDRQRDGLRDAGDGRAARTALGDAESGLPAVVCGGHRRSGRGCDRRHRHEPCGSVPGGGHDLHRRGHRHRDTAVACAPWSRGRPGLTRLATARSLPI